MTRPGIPSDLTWIQKIIDESPHAAQWIPSDTPCLVVEPLGFLAYRQVAPDEYEILNLAVAVEARRKGIATLLLQSALTQGGRWFLEVRESNNAALKTYQSIGFQMNGKRRKYYQNPSEDAIVLMWQP